MDFTNLKIDINSLLSQFVYDPKAPMIFNTGFFLLWFFGVMLIYQMVKNRQNLKVFYLTIVSLYFYYKSSGDYFILLIISTFIDFYLAKWIYIAKTKLTKKLLLVLSLFANLGLLAYFKYTNFLIEIFNNLSSNDLSFAKIFLPVGISFYIFQTLSYTIDVYRGELKPLRKLMDFAFFVSFFPQLVAGPIVRAKDFIPQIRKPILVNREQMGRAVYLIACGLIKKAVISDYISINFVDRVFDNPMLYSGFENLMAVYGYALQIYCDFSGYSDVAIGIALLMGFNLCINFNSPYQATSLTDFWRRWHISLSTWLRDYLYISLGGNRKGKLRQYFNLIITMLLGGLWHGASWKFVFWGGMHGSLLALEKFFGTFIKVPKNLFFRIIGIVLTFHFVCFCWIYFRAASFQDAVAVLNQIFNSFNGQIAQQVVLGYKAVFILFIIGYVIHFIPKVLKKMSEQAITKSPLILKSIFLAFVIWIIIQTKSAEIQPFIYFQF